MENNFKAKNFTSSLKFALNGLKNILKNERNVKIHLVIAIMALILSFILKISRLELLIVLLTIFLVIFSEIVNTIIEQVLNIYDSKYNEDIKYVKDISAGLVLFSAILSVIIGASIFIPKLIEIIKK